MRKTRKEKSQRAAGRHPYAFPSNRKNRGGAPPGLIRVKLKCWGV